MTAILAITAMAAAPLLAATDGGMTTADLALQLARAAGLGLPADETPDAARGALVKAGIDLGGDLKAPVTEKVLVQVGQALGVKVSSAHPDAAVTPALSSVFIRLIKGPLLTAAAIAGPGGADTVHASCQGRESRAGRRGAPASPSDFNATAGPCEEPAP